MIISKSKGIRRGGGILRPKGLKRTTGRIKPRKRRKKGKKGKTPKLSVLKRKLEVLLKAVVIKKYGKDCHTCPQTNLVGSNCQLGHVPWPRSILSTECKYSPDFCRIQCFLCNIHRGGMGAVAYARLQREGVDVAELRFRNELTKGKVYKPSWFIDKIEEYTKLLESPQSPPKT